MDRYLLISADCHAGPLPDQARGYVSPKYRNAFDEWIGDKDVKQRRRAEHTGAAIYGDEALAGTTATPSPVQGLATKGKNEKPRAASERRRTARSKITR